MDKAAEEKFYVQLPDDVAITLRQVVAQSGKTLEDVLRFMSALEEVIQRSYRNNAKNQL